jgi:hypothetical protein
VAGQVGIFSWQMRQEAKEAMRKNGDVHQNISKHKRLALLLKEKWA